MWWNSLLFLRTKSTVVLSALSLLALQACANRHELYASKAIHIHVSANSFIVNSAPCDSYAHLRRMLQSVRDDPSAINITVAPGVDRTRVNDTVDVIVAAGLTVPILITENAVMLSVDEPAPQR